MNQGTIKLINLEFGLKILVYVRKLNKNLFFENLTMAPIEKDLINYQLINN